jgi:glutamyl-tRNA reductase
MALFALGVNHATAPLDVRSRLAIAPTATAQALRGLRALPGVAGAAVLSTCNRTELYLTGSVDTQQPVLDWLHQFQSTGERFDRLFYQHRDEDAVRHVFRVATGLDSMVIGEPQILGQLKDAWQHARAAESMAAPLDQLFQRSFAVAKKVRHETGIGHHPVSMAYAAVRTTRQVFDSLEERMVLLIGAGETGALVAEHLRAQGVRRMVIANRSTEAALALAARMEAVAIGLDRIHDYLAEADVIICATAATTPLIDAAGLKRALKGHRRRLRLLLDLSVPRNIAVDCAELDDTVLYGVDDLSAVIEESQRSRRLAADQAEVLIDVQVSEFMHWWRGRDALTPLKQLRERNARVSEEVLEHALRRLQHGGSAEDALRFLAHTLTNKLQHAPSHALQVAAGCDDRVLLHAATRLFALSESQPE